MALDPLLVAVLALLSQRTNPAFALEMLHRRHPLHLAREELDSFLDFLERLNRAHHTLRLMWSISESRIEFLDLNTFKGPRFNDTNHLDHGTGSI